MRRVASFIVDHRLIILAVACVVSGLFALAIPRVEVITDMAKYLPTDSQMRQGMDVIEEEFPPPPELQSIRVMFDNLDAEQQAAVGERLRDVPGIAAVTFDPDPANAAFHSGVHTLYQASTTPTYGSAEEAQLFSALEREFSELTMVYANDDRSLSSNLPLRLVLIALALLALVLFAMSASWIEPLLFVIAIGAAVVLNLGTNIVQGNISETTFSVAALLQLVLSMDYSIILMNRYRQERADSPSAPEAMKRALRRSFSTVAGSSLTTIVGLLMLCFMTLKVGADLGIVLAKGVLLSMLSVFLVLPGIIVIFDRAITVTSKPYFHPKLPRLARAEYRGRWFVLAAFVVVLVGSSIAQGATNTAYTLVKDDAVSEVFARDNPLVLVYENDAAAEAEQIAAELRQDPRVRSVDTYSSTLGSSLTAEEMGAMLAPSGVDATMIGVVYYVAFGEGAESLSLPELVAASRGGNPAWRMTVPELLDRIPALIDDPRFSAFITPELRSSLGDPQAMLAQAGAQFVGPTYSRMIVTTSLPDEGSQTAAFVTSLMDRADGGLRGAHYLVGASVMNVELEDGFAGQMLLIMILTAAAIFLIVMVTFRSVVVPLLLVITVQSGVFVTVTIIGVQGYDVYFMALLIVQCILMGATIDYAIVYTTYYRSARRTMGIRESIAEAYQGSIHTILTSGLIMIIVTGILGFLFENPTVGQICQTISIGATSATLLVIFLLPGVLACGDRFVVGKRRERL